MPENMEEKKAPEAPKAPEAKKGPKGKVKIRKGSVTKYRTEEEAGKMASKGWKIVK